MTWPAFERRKQPLHQSTIEAFRCIVGDQDQAATRGEAQAE